jgi:hypothetical protein
MKQLRGPIGRLHKQREELAKAWLMRLIERSSLEEIGDIPTGRIASELPHLISDVLRAVADESSDPGELSAEQYERAATLAELRAGSDRSAADLARDIAALQIVITRALREEAHPLDPDAFADTVERLAEVTGAIQAAAAEEVVVAVVAAASVATTAALAPAPAAAAAA